MSSTQTPLQFEEGARVVHRQDGSAGIFMNVEREDLARVLWNGEKESALTYVGDLDLADLPAALAPVPSEVTSAEPFKIPTFESLALPMAALNLPTIRLKAKSKEPMDRAWQNIATTNVDTILVQNSETPYAGCACVAKNDGVCFLEVDETGVVERYERETGETFPEPNVQSRPGRLHYYMWQTPETIACGNISQKELVWGSFRQRDQYVVAAGSIHAVTGQPYQLLSSSIAPAPNRLIGWLTAQRTKSTEKANQNLMGNDPIPLGQHDVTLFAIACALRKDGLEYDEMLPVVMRHAERCTSRGSDWVDMVKNKCRSACHYPAGNPTPTVLIAGKLPGQNVTQTVTQTPENVVPPPDGHYTEEIAEQEEQAQEEQYQASLLNQEPMPETEEEAQAQLATRPHALLRTPTEGSPYFDADNILYGISGRIIRKIDAESESHPAGNLLEFLVGFGNLIGRGPYFMHESTKHFTNEFGIRVGESALSRKGTGKDRVQELLWKLDHRWMTDCVKGGFGSGQAIIQAVTDEIKQIRLDKKGKRVEVIVAQDVPDKRLLISQGEFSGVLKMAAMEGSLFSEVFRDAYDCKKLENTVKGTPNKCLEPFISCCCDTNLEDLKSLLQDSPNAGNGFGNRFMFAYVERTKDIPSGGAQLDWSSELGAPEVGDPADQPEWFLEPDQFDGPPNAPVVPVAKKGSLLDIVEHARQRKEVKRSWVAERAWLNMYPSFEPRVRGMNKSAASIVTRVEAHMARISMLYALLDMSEHIEPRHLYAAKALWDYCCDSAEWIFAGRTADLQLIMNRLATREADKKEQTAAQIQNAVFRTGHSKRPRPVAHVEGCCNFLWKRSYLRRLVSETGVYRWTRSGAKREWRVGGVTNLLAHSR